MLLRNDACFGMVWRLANKTRSRRIRHVYKQLKLVAFRVSRKFQRQLLFKIHERRRKNYEFALFSDLGRCCLCIADCYCRVEAGLASCNQSSWAD